MKRKLRKWVKVVLTIILIGISILLYSYAGVIGELAQIYKVYQLVCICVWGWLLVGQMIVYGYLWSK